MKRIKVKYVDWWEGFSQSDCIIGRILKSKYEVVESDEPDYLFSSVYSKEASNYDCIKIFYSPENFTPDFNLFDYAIGFDNISFNDRYIRIPNYIMNPKYEKDIVRMIHKHEEADENKEFFCNYIVSNGEGDKIRTDFFEELSKYKKVNSGGKYKNNIGLPEGISDKYEFQKKHKFSICFENSSNKDYITEKIVQAFAARTIPIYWGAPNVNEYFNSKAMIILNNKDDIENTINEVMKIDSDDTLFYEMINEPAVKSVDDIVKLYSDLETFITNIIEQPYDRAKRRPESNTVKAYYYSNMNNDKTNKKGILRKFQKWKLT